MRLAHLSHSLAAASLMLVACAGGSETPPGTGTAGTSATGAAGTTTTGAAGTSATGAAGTGAAGTNATGAAGTGSAAAGTTGAGGTSSDGGAGSSGSRDASADYGDGPLTTAGCAGKSYQLCIDFEDGIDTATWTGGTPNMVVTDHVAHGTHAYHLYTAAKNGMLEMRAGRLQSTKVGTIKSQVWSRFYIHFSPGAPGGHQNIVAAYAGGTWYEIGVQFDGIMGVWHGGGGETPLRSMPLIVDQWYCVEAYFDGGAAAAPRWWIDGSEAAYYMPGGGPKITAITQFTRLEAGFTSYAGLGLKMPDGKGDQTETRLLQDLWIDDIAFDTQRIGCIP